MIHRQTIQVLSLLSFPATVWYLSPYLPYRGIFEGVVAGSLLVFVALFGISAFLGRWFCGWLCPVGAVQHCALTPRTKTSRRASLWWIKYALWFPWVGGILALLVAVLVAGRSLTPDLVYATRSGLSVTEPGAYVIYAGVLALALVSRALWGRRAFCHALCWIAPFQVFGADLGRALGLPQLHIVAGKGCTSCARCTNACPMGVPVSHLAQTEGRVVHADCILCGRFAEDCPRSVLALGLVKGQKTRCSRPLDLWPQMMPHEGDEDQDGHRKDGGQKGPGRV